MDQRAARSAGATRGRALRVLPVPIFALYLFCSLCLPGDADILKYDSSIYDADVARVVRDWTGLRSSVRTVVHPLYRLAIAPFGTALKRVLPAGAAPEQGSAPPRLRRMPAEALLSARILAALFMTATVLLAGRLAQQLAGGDRVPALITACVCALSFSAILLGAIPETASASGIASLTPLLYLNRRLDRPFGRSEAVVWGLIGVLCFAITISQLMYWGIALLVRVIRLLRGRSDASGSPRSLGINCFVLLATFVLVAWMGLQIQSQVYPGTEFRAQQLFLEQSFLELAHLKHDPLERIVSVLLHFWIYDFAAPQPGYSDFIRFYPINDFWTLSLAESRIRDWHWLQIPLFGAIAILVGVGLAACSRGNVRFLAPSLGVFAQLSMHIAYGKEPIIYSSNFHGVLVAMVVAASWNTFVRHRRTLCVIWLVLSIGMLANNLAVLQHLYAEIESGLDAVLRDPSGRLK